ncbi:hypothetical protein GCM10009557_00550 [Virgisporangium ochraceum]|uniref:Uncharacterized protein n=1 Tax=Virgisporangium ochraceum TaxID=65505 RepID=A0A8J4A1K0_9ACTN|nr:hypothetical protein [Virgisporangium ochraceum]GIJ74087.1 hypothetical protein Voc01_090040 [Virgisporangium ochraceum]
MKPTELSDVLQALVSDVQQAMQELSGPLRWADEEIAAAAARHPDAAAAVDASFRLLAPTHSLFRTEDLYRAHCVEILDRLATGDDTRPGTAAECCAVLSEVSLEVPLPTHAAGLYARMWSQAGLRPAALADMRTHYEAISATQIDDLETELRHKLRQDWRIRQ